MLYKKNSRFLDIISLINESIDNLLKEEVIVTPITDGKTKTKKQKFMVVEDGQLPPNTDTEFFIELKNAKEYKNDVKVGDEIEIEVVDLESMTDDGVLEFLSSNEITTKELEQIVLARGTTIRVAGKILRYGPRQLNRIKQVANAAIQMKKYSDRYGKKLEHSRCYCNTIFDDNVDEDTGKADKGVYKSTISDQPEHIQEELLATWEFCENKYGKFIIDKDDRAESSQTCVELEGWYEDAESLIDDLISDLQQYYTIKGYKKGYENKKTYGADKGVGEKIVTHDAMLSKFSSNVEYTPSGVGTYSILFNDNDVVKFEILKTYGNRSDTVLVERQGTSNKYVMGFDSAKEKSPQSSNAFWVVNTDGSISNIRTVWSGKILEFED